MSVPPDRLRLLLTALYALWLMVFVYAFVAYARSPYEGAGFPDGLNKPAVFLGWQGAAGVISVAVWGLGRSWPKGNGVRALSAIPLVIALLLGLAVLGVIYWTGAA